MTGKQKVQLVTKIIAQESKRLISGNTVTVSSDKLEEAGISLREQVQILDVLAESAKPIRYTVKPTYQSEAEIDPNTRFWVQQTAMLNFEPEQALIDRLLQSCTYVIELLDPAVIPPTADSESTAVNLPSDKQEFQVSLRLMTKTLRLYIDGKPNEVVKKFKSKKANNIRAYHELQLNRGRYLDKEQMHIKGKSVVKDLPKTMGLDGVLAEHFIDIDSKGQRLKIPTELSMSRSELEILLEYVKRKSQAK